MGEIVTVDCPTKKQNDFIHEKYPQFLSCLVYGYLFEGLHLRQIEHKYLDVDAQGFFAKVALNQLGIDTSKESKNKGKCAGLDPKIVAKNLLDDEDVRLNNIGRLILEFSKR